MGLSITTNTAHGKNAQKPTGIIKLQATSPAKPKFQLRSIDKHFWYIAPDGITRLATSSDATVIPKQTNTYIFNPSHFASEPYPSTMPRGGVWPPKAMEDVICAVDDMEIGCVGEKCYTNEICDDTACQHTLSNWTEATADWEDHVELRTTASRGIGVFTKHDFCSSDVLGWYAGELKTLDTCGDGNYLMEMDIGALPADESDSDADDEVEVEEIPEGAATVFIDGEKWGNWTRFINHSCEPHAVFRIRRVGDMRIMTVEAIRDISAGEELTVDYGDEYYGLKTLKVCCCGTKNCVGRKRRVLEEARVKEEGRKAKVKKCKRLSSSVE
jgi:hypothetical protein